MSLPKGCGQRSAAPLRTDHSCVETLHDSPRSSTMSDTLSRIKAAVARIQGQDPHLAAEMNARRNSPAVAEEARGLESMRAETSAGPPVNRDLVLETIVLRVGRPVLAIQRDEAVLQFRDADSEVWRDRLQ